MDPLRQRRQSLPKYRKHRASGQAVVTLNGKDFYLGPHGTRASKAEYDRLLGEWLAAGRQLPAEAEDEAPACGVCSVRRRTSFEGPRL